MRSITLDSTAAGRVSQTDIVPARLLDHDGTVYKDRLYSLYTSDIMQFPSYISVSLIISDLVRHNGVSGRDGYWCGIAILKSRVPDNAVVTQGYGSGLEASGEGVAPTMITDTIDGRDYYCFYWDVEAIRSVSDYGNHGWVATTINDIRTLYSVSFEQVKLKESEEQVSPLIWDGVTTQSIRDDYLFGIDLSDANGNPLPEGLFVHYLNSAVDYIQNLLDITIPPTMFVERHDYIRNDYQNWGFIQLDHNPVAEVKSLIMYYGDRPSVEIPPEWIKLDKLSGQITLFPAAGSANSLIIGQTGLLYGFQSQWDYAPMLWEVEYVAGIDRNDKSMPLELLRQAIAERASIGILNVWGDLIIGAGIANQSVSIDGVSQSIGTTQSAMYGGASARITQYNDDLTNALMPALRQKFGGIRMVVV